MVIISNLFSFLHKVKKINEYQYGISTKLMGLEFNNLSLHTTQTNRMETTEQKN